MRFLTLSVVATLMSAPAFSADLGMYRPGTPYNSAVSGGADVCDSQCAGDAQCRGWNYVKPNPQAPGICEYLSSVSTPVPSQISISGENLSAASYSSRVTSGGTNTVRVGTQVSQPVNTVSVGQTSPSRRVVRQPVPQRATAQTASTRSVDPMSLTAQQNRYRQGQNPAQQSAQGGYTQTQAQLRAPQFSPQQFAPQRAIPQQAYPQRAVPRQGIPQQANRQAFPAQRPMFQPMLDSAAPATSPQQQQAVQPQRQTDRRATGPRRAAARAQTPAQGGTPYPPQAPYQAGPQAPASQPQASYAPNPAWRNQAPQQAPQTAAPQNFAQAQGSSRPPVGQPIIPQPQPPARPQRSTPSSRLAQFTAQSKAGTQPILSEGSVALDPQQARKSLFGSLNDDLAAPASSALSTATAVPTVPVSQQALGEVLAGGN